MTINDGSIGTYEVREVLAAFHDAGQFETAVQQLEDSGISREAIDMIASHDAVRDKLGHIFKSDSDIREDKNLPQAIYEDKHEIAGDKALAVGVPVYICGAGAGLAVVASGGTLVRTAVQKFTTEVAG